MNFSDRQLTKTSDDLLDISKLLTGATFVAIFAPGTIIGFNIWSFAGGLILAILIFIWGIKILPKS